MAIIHSKASDHEKTKERRIRFIAGVFLTGVFGYLFFSTNQAYLRFTSKYFPEWYVFAVLFGFIVGCRITWVVIKEVFGPAKEADKGTQGEKATQDSLARLPNDYHLFSNLQIHVEGRPTGELDNIVVGPNSVFVVETKNWEGYVEGDVRDERWTYEHNDFSEERHSPVHQVSTHVSKLSQFLSENGVKTRIQGIVVFISPAISLDLENLEESRVPVFAGGDVGSRLRQYITGFPAARTVTETDITNVIRALAAEQNRPAPTPKGFKAFVKRVWGIH